MTSPRMARAVMMVALVALSAMQLCAGLPHAGYFRKAKAGTLPGEWHMHSYHKGDDGLHTMSFISMGFPLQAGEVVFTYPPTTILPFPAGPIAIKSFRAEVVDEYNASVPLYEAYNHHWIVMKNNGENNLGECPQALPYVFGVGEESRNTFVNYPDPYRLLANGTETWTANIHIIRTVNVPAVKQCIECHCGDVNNPYNGGGFSCCEDGSFCPTNPGPQPPAKTYFLKYEIMYNDPSPNWVPLDVYVFDASDCRVEYNVPPCEDPSTGCITSITKSYTFSNDVNIVYAVGHVHLGSVNISLTLDGKDEPICTSIPYYGNGTQPGNENGYVVGLSDCTFPNTYHVPANSVVRYTGTYNNTIYHDTVMSLFYLAVVQSKDSPHRQLIDADPTHVDMIMN